MCTGSLCYGYTISLIFLSLNVIILYSVYTISSRDVINLLVCLVIFSSYFNCYTVCRHERRSL